MEKKIVRMLVYSLFVAMLLTACSATEDQSGSAVEKNEPSASTSIQSDGKTEQEESKNLSQNSNETVATEEITEMNLQMKIGDTYVQVDWADNESVEDLKNLCKEEPLVLQMSMYGGFEQVGSIGTYITRNDVQTTTQAGDIVLYSGSNIVVFYGSNSWAYTRLGYITDLTDAELTNLLSNGDVTITISMEE